MTVSCFCIPSKCRGHTGILYIMPTINYYSTSCSGHPPRTNYSCNNVIRNEQQQGGGNNLVFYSTLDFRFQTKLETSNFHEETQPSAAISSFRVRWEGCFMFHQTWSKIVIKLSSQKNEKISVFLKSKAWILSVVVLCNKLTKLVTVLNFA